MVVMTVSPALIKQLRESTGAGMMDCKKALDENNGNMEEAVDWLRKKGLASAAKKSGRIAAEGLVAVAAKPDMSAAAMVEVNSETDFVARNDQFQGLADVSSKYALEVKGDLESLLNHTCPVAKKTVTEVVTESIASIGENIQVRRSVMLSVNPGVVATYIHSAIKPGMGKIGVLVAVKSEGDKAKLEAFGKQIAMHIAAARPEALTREEVKADSIERERAIFKEQAIASGKTPEIAEKMVEGRIRKYYEEVVLPEQVFMIDGKTRITDVIAAFAKELGSPVEIVAFERFALGEGIEKKEDDFAAEVAKAAGVA